MKIVVWVSDLLMCWQKSTKKIFVIFYLKHSYEESWILYQDNAPANSALYATTFWSKISHFRVRSSVLIWHNPRWFQIFTKIISDFKEAKCHNVESVKTKAARNSQHVDRRGLPALKSGKFGWSCAGIAKGNIFKAINFMM